MQPSVLLTGVTGVLGPELLYELLHSSDADVVCLVRADDEVGAEQRLRGVVTRLLGDRGWESVRRRVSAVSGDVTLPLLGLSDQTLGDIAQRVTHIVHGAASVRFDHDLRTARRINLGGTRSVLNFARICHRRGRLDRLGYVSTAFVGGRHPRLGENDLARGQTLRHTYERSKYQAELLPTAHLHRVPITVVKPSIVVGHSESGLTTGFNVIY